MGEIQYDRELDCRKMNCPLPVVKTRKEIENMKKGEVLRLTATDPGSQRDIPAFCNRTGHELLDAREEDRTFTFYIKK